MEFIKSQKQKNKLIFEGRVYNKKKTRVCQYMANADIYECAFRVHSGRHINLCNGRVTIRNGEVVHRKAHICAPDERLCAAERAKSEIRYRARSTQEQTGQILRSCTAAMEQGAVALMPHRETMKRNIRRHRQKAADVPANPATRDDLPYPLPDKYRFLMRGNQQIQFLQYDSNDADRILIFATDDGLRCLQEAVNWHCDGTFTVVPLQYMQLYTIHVLVDNHGTIPVVFALLPNKRQATYERMFREVKRVCPNANPASVLVDFERAAINALRIVFPVVIINGCFFHLSNSVQKRVNENGLINAYREDDRLAREARMIPALAFLPPDKIRQGFDCLVRQMRRNRELRPILNYFEATYIGQVQYGVAHPPMFAPILWSVYNRINEGLPRTNNSVEGWHRAFTLVVGQHHSNIWRFFDVLIEEESHSFMRYVHFIQGRPGGRRRNTYVNLDERVVDLAEDYNDDVTARQLVPRQIYDYLSALAMNYIW